MSYLTLCTVYTKVIIEKSWGGRFLCNRNWDLGWICVDWQYWKKRVWADYEQLLSVVFSFFQGQKQMLFKRKIVASAGLIYNDFGVHYSEGSRYLFSSLTFEQMTKQTPLFLDRRDEVRIKMGWNSYWRNIVKIQRLQKWWIEKSTPT